MKVFKSVLLFLFVPVLVYAADDTIQVRANVGEVKDTRTTGQFFAGLDIELNLLSQEVEKAKGLRFVVQKAVDDLGNDLIKEDETPELEELSRFGSGPATITVSLENPARRAEYVKELSGVLELFIPANDPDSVAAIDKFQEKTGEPVKSAKLEKAGIQLELLTKEQYEESKKQQSKDMSEEAGGEFGQAFAEAFGAMFGGFGAVGENSVIMKMKDPGSKIISIDFVDPSGEEIDSMSRMTMGEISVYDFSEPLPEDAGIRVYLSTEKALIKAPLSVKDIALP